MIRPDPEPAVEPPTERLASMRSFWIAQVLGWPVAAIAIHGPHYERAAMRGMPLLDWTASSVVWALFGLLVSTGLAAWYMRQPERFFRGLGLLSVLGVCLLGSLLWFTVLPEIEDLLGLPPMRPPRHGRPGWSLVFPVVGNVMLLGTWSALFLVALFTRRVQAAREHIIAASALAHEAQLQLLRSQLNPHFLFNSLNSVIALVDEEPRKAQQMVRDLATLLRRGLDAAKTDEGTVREELEFIRLYVGCEQVRFEERLEVSYDVSDEVLDEPIPPLILHPLVENAVKHGMAVSALPLKVQIHGARSNGALVLEVRNTGSLDAPTSDIGAAGQGVGLRNVRARLEELYPDRHVLDLSESDGWVVARLEVPRGAGEASS